VSKLSRDEYEALLRARNASIAMLETALAECQKVRDQWCKEFTEQRDDAEALVKRCAALETEAWPRLGVPCPKCNHDICVCPSSDL
jgi:hypothetical protein